MKQANLVPDRAATLVVHPTPGQGDATTIEDAVAMIAVLGGGEIFVREGAYAPAAAIVLPNFPISIKGVGDTVAITAPSALPLFSVGVAATSRYFFSGFSVTGNNSIGQALINLDSAVDVVFEDVQTSAVRDIVDTSTTPDVTFARCLFAMTAANNWSFWRGTSTGGTLNWDLVEVTVGATQSTTGIVGAPDWAVTASYVGGGGPLTSLCVLGRVEIQGFRADKLHFQMTSPGCRIVNYFAIDGNIEVLNAQTAIANSVFTTPTLSGSQMAVEGPGGAGGVVEVTISGCVFDGGGVQGTNSQVDVLNVQGVVITGCSFNNNGAGNTTDANVSIGSTGGTCILTVEGCIFAGGNPAGKAILEFFGLATITGVYNGNIGLNPNNFTVVSSLSTVNGMKMFSQPAGTTTAVPVTQLSYFNPRGLMGIGAIKNTGGVNTMTVTTFATDAFGSFMTVNTDVAPGATLTLSALVANGISIPPFLNYGVEVMDKVAGNHTTFNLQFTATGVES